MPKQPVQKDFFKIFFIPVAVIFLLLLATFNLQSYLKTEDEGLVLGDTASLNEESVFWKEFLISDPNYIPGWEEYAKINHKLGNREVVEAALKRIEEIDPNYEVILEDF